MNCPRCESALLDERDRDGITIDVRQNCRGIWLDRGELERLVARANEDRDHFEHQRGYVAIGVLTAAMAPSPTPTNIVIGGMKSAAGSRPTHHVFDREAMATNTKRELSRLQAARRLQETHSKPPTAPKRQATGRPRARRTS